MISIDWFRNNFELLIKRYEGREVPKERLSEIKALDIEVTSIKKQLDECRERKNILTKSYDAEKKSDILSIKSQESSLNNEYLSRKRKLNELLCTLPAIPEGEVPLLESAILKEWGERKSKERCRSYLEIVDEFRMCDFEASSLISGSGFSVYTGDGEKLIRSLISLTLDWVEKHGYTRYWFPSIVTEDSLYCTSQLSKFRDNLFELQGNRSFLSPTSEVQLVNIFRGKIISESSLPIRMSSNTNCFREEQRSAGVLNRGLLRMYQFNKTEIVTICREEDSDEIYLQMSNLIESLLESLSLPYRKVLIARSELSFSSTKTYDFEVWMPSLEKYVELSSLSNTSNFQSLRGKIRYKSKILDSSEKSKYVHILNGSCLAIDRLFACILENHQSEDGEIIFPSLISTYFGRDRLSAPRG